jgi:predicted DNA-binding transcriptional regulator AlpA
MDLQNEILTVEELATLLKMKRRQIYEMTRGRARVRQALPLPLPLLRINGNLRFRRTDVAKWLDELAEHERKADRLRT